MQTGVLIECIDVRKSFAVRSGQVEVLHGISLSVRGGEFVAIMGPSGSGKSTLLNCLAGLDDPTAGRITLLGASLGDLSLSERARMRRSQVGFVFQSYNLVPTMTGHENVCLPFWLGGRRPPKQRIREVMDRVGIAHLTDQRPPSMSGGEQQRIALARVLALNPPIIFADEPTGALDTRTGQIVLEELVQLAHQPGRCVIAVTHDPRVAARADRILFLLDGDVVREEPELSAERVGEILASLSAKAVVR